MIALLMFGAAIFIFVMGLLIMKYAQFLVSVMVERKHSETEHIIASETVPPRWCKGLFAYDILAPVAKFRSTRRLNNLVRYFDHTPLVEDEGTRKQIVENLARIGDQWRGMAWKEIVEYRRS